MRPPHSPLTLTLTSTLTLTLTLTITLTLTLIVILTSSLAPRTLTFSVEAHLCKERENTDCTLGSYVNALWAHTCNLGENKIVHWGLM